MAERIKPGIDVVREEMIRQRDEQMASFNSLDTKSGVMLGFQSLLFVNLFQYPMNSFCALLGFAGVFLSLILMAWGIRLRVYRIDPHPKELINDYMFREADPDSDETKPSAKEQILVDQYDAYSHNKGIVHDKAQWFKRSLVVLLLSVFILGADKIGGAFMIDKPTSQPATSQPTTTPPVQGQVAKPNPAAVNTIQKSLNQTSPVAKPNANAVNVLLNSQNTPAKANPAARNILEESK